MVAYGSSARICQKTVKLARAKGIKAGLFRPITLYPFPGKELSAFADTAKLLLTAELSAGQMVEDVKLSVGDKTRVEFYGRCGGMIYSPDEILGVVESLMN